MLSELLLRIGNALDYLILPLKIEWKHHYRRERVQLYPSVSFCNQLQELGVDIKHDIVYPNYFDLVLYDGDEVVLLYGCRDFKDDKEMINSTNDEFLERMDEYIERHKYFSLFLWIQKKLYPLQLDEESMK